MGPFDQQQPWGTRETVLIACHTIFIAVPGLFMGPSSQLRAQPLALFV